MQKLCARDVMTTEVTTVTADTLVSQLIELVRDRKYSGVPVVSGEGDPVGLISQNDVLRALAYVCAEDGLPVAFHEEKRRASSRLLQLAEEASRGVALSGFLRRPVSELMTPWVESCTPDTPIAEVCESMVAKAIHRVVVLDGGKVCGLISATDLVRRFGEEARQA